MFRTLKFGSVDHTGLIRIHPVLDKSRVPAWFVRFIIFHELLHGVHKPTSAPNGRRSIHTPAFRSAERAHPDYARSVAWREANLGQLLRWR
jgi:predicted metal-dependent hydrolase